MIYWNKLKQHTGLSSEIKSFNVILLCIFVAVLWVGCVQRSENQGDEKIHVAKFEPFEIKYARGFSVQQSDTNVFVLIHDPNTRQVIDSLNVTGQNPYEVRYFNRLVTQSTTHFAFLQSLNKLDGLLGLCGIKYLDSLQKKAILSTAEICNAQGIDLEKIVNLNADLVFLYPFGDKDKEQLHRFGISTLFLTEYLETSPLARAEWLKFFALISGQDPNATSFEQIENTYLSLIQDKREKKHHETVKYRDQGIFNDEKTKPRPNSVAFNLPYGDTWDMPSGNSISATLVKDAGLNYFLRSKTETGNLLFRLEEAYHHLGITEYWVIVAERPKNFSLEDLKKENRIYSTFPSVQFNKVIFCNTSTTPYFSQGPIEPHILLQYLINCIDGNDTTNKYFFLLR